MVAEPGGWATHWSRYRVGSCIANLHRTAHIASRHICILPLIGSWIPYFCIAWAALAAGCSRHCVCWTGMFIGRGGLQPRTLLIAQLAPFKLLYWAAGRCCGLCSFKFRQCGRQSLPSAPPSCVQDLATIRAKLAGHCHIPEQYKNSRSSMSLVVWAA